ncbi:AAA family ATPase [Empedobacter stercoris]|uniref:AAA family ATPase n=1 Tax=Empedobacter stercoris TaxID=1628248 RepID=UPI0021AF082E|nr:AAA family ATPase [Empedobacter stercoris]UWX68153.1 AAA family ATPase [Empedobacter stercoris]
MKNYIQVNNFRKYISTPEIELNDLNFFVGTNSSGKSTIVKSYLLIYNFLKSGKLFEIDFSDALYKDLNIQDFKKQICQFSDNNDTMKFNVSLNDFNFELELGEHQKSNFAKVLLFKITDLKNNIAYKYHFKKGNLMNLPIGYDSENSEMMYGDQLTENLFTVSFINNQDYVEDILDMIKKDEMMNTNDEFTLELLAKEYVILSNGEEFSDYSIDFIPLNYNLPNNLNNAIKSTLKDYDDLLGKEIKFLIDDYIEKYNPTKEEIVAHYRIKSILKSENFYDKIFFTGNRLLDFIEDNNLLFLPLAFKKYTNLNSIVDKSNDLAQLVHNYYSAEDKSKNLATEFINYWIGKEHFNIGKSFEINFYGGEAYEILIIENEGVKIPLTDKGTGNVQIFKILLLIATQIKSYVFNPTIILEEPELNLHPSLQSKLADLLISTYNDSNKYHHSKDSKFQFIVETHSEYLIRRLQVLSIQNKLDRNNLSITYFPTELNQDPYQLKINKDGSLDKNFGSGFFDEAGNHMLELMRFNLTSKN